MRRKATPAEINAAFEAYRARKGEPLNLVEINALDAALAEEIERDDLVVDSARVGPPTTNIFVRALDDIGYRVADIAELDRNSLLRWLRIRGGSNPWAENTVLILLGHKPDHQ